MSIHVLDAVQFPGLEAVSPVPTSMAAAPPPISEDFRVTTASAQALACNAHIAGLPRYNAGLNIAVARAMTGRDDVAGLASNENPFGCSPAVAAALAGLNPARYSDPASTVLRQALAERLAVPPARIVAANGSEEIIAAISRAFLGEGTSALTVAPCFGLHEIQPLAMGAVVKKVPMTAALGFDVPAIISALAEEPRVFFISTPWNPVGATLTTDELQAILAAVRPGTLLALDEAYFEFRDAASPDGLRLVHQTKLNWVVLRTFSKAYGLAGLRVGYGVTSDESIARLIDAAHTPFNVNSAAQAAAVAALADSAWMEQAVARLNAAREDMRRGLHGLGLRVAPSQGNFLFVDVGQTAAPIAQKLLQLGLITKAWAEPGYTQFLRISVGMPADNARVINGLGQVLA